MVCAPSVYLSHFVRAVLGDQYGAAIFAALGSYRRYLLLNLRCSTVPERDNVIAGLAVDDGSKWLHGDMRGCEWLRRGSWCLS